MALRIVKPRGFCLIELVVASCVACIVAAMATVSLAAAGVTVHRHLVTSRTEDRAWLALAAIVRDLEAARSWQRCTEARDCPAKDIARAYDEPVLVAGRIGWLVTRNLYRCDAVCEVFIEDVEALDIIADLPAGDGLIIRQPFQQRHGDAATALQVTLRMRDGRRFSRVVSRPGKIG